MINITRSGNNVIVTSDNPKAFNISNGELSVPMNSIYYVLDEESDFIQFNSLDEKGEILFNGVIGDIQVNGTLVTREDIQVQLDSVFNTASGSGGNSGVESVNGMTGAVTLKTINGQELTGLGDITIEGGGDVDLSDYYNKSEVDTITNSLVTNVAVMGGNRIAVIQKNGNVPQEIYFPTINGQQILGVEGNITIEGGSSGSETDPIFEAWKNGTSIALGYNASVTDTDNEHNGIALGDNVSVEGLSVGVGSTSNAKLRSTAVGVSCIAQGQESVAFGNNAYSFGKYDIAIGYNVYAMNGNQIVIGNNISMTENDSVNIGNVLKGDTSNYAYVLNEYGNYVRIPTEWTGTQSEYDALGTYYDNITYNIIEG